MSLYIKRAAVIFVVMMFSVSYLAITLYNRDFKDVFSGTNGKTVIIDAGHGEPDGGAVAPDGTCEEKINLEISKKLSAILEEKCYNVIMTRENNEGIHTSGNSVKEKKLSDMHNREKLMNSSGADIFVSIHMNKFSDPKVFGAQVFYSSNGEESASLAEHIQSELLLLDKNNKRVSKAAENAIYLMKCASIPAVIVECGFLSNPEECEKLKTDAYKTAVANAICTGIENYFRERES